MQVNKLFLDVLNGGRGNRVPFWFMRQAGRYLPEYRELRAKTGGFLKMVYNPKVAAEITMQPVRRFGMDAAIIFSDILTVPQALGQKLEFMEGEGPKLEALTSAKGFSKLNFKNFDGVLSPVYEAISTVKTQLTGGGFSQTALIGFCGAPFTLAAYMLEGGGSKDFMAVKTFAYQDPENFENLIDTLVEASVMYLSKQVDAGAEALQIFDSWAGVLDSDQFEKWVTLPTQKIVKAVKQKHPQIPIIGFPRMAGENYAGYAKTTGVQGLGLDTGVPTKWAAEALQGLATLQGNLDPACLMAGGDAMLSTARRILSDLSSGSFVFNLGHGVHKDTPVEHVETLVRFLKDYKLQ